MSRPSPAAGQVVRFEYLWASEAFQDGLTSGAKHRPCVVLAALPNAVGWPKVLLCGITHTKPSAPSEGVLLPKEVKKELGLDDEPSWIVTSEVNTVDWHDMRFILAPKGSWTYGVMAAEVMEEVRQRIAARNRAGVMEFVNRAEIDTRAAGPD